MPKIQRCYQLPKYKTGHVVIKKNVYHSDRVESELKINGNSDRAISNILSLISENPFIFLRLKPAPK